MKSAVSTQKTLCLLVVTLLSIWLLIFTTDGFAHSVWRSNQLHREEAKSLLMATL